MEENSAEGEKHILWGEAALIVAVIINSFGVVLMLYSGSGISAISSVPFAFFRGASPVITGYLDLYFSRIVGLKSDDPAKRFVPQYLFSFVVGFVFGKLLDANDFWIHILPNELWMRVIYFAISYLLISFGIALSNRCCLPVTPTDLFPRELSKIICVAYSRIKISFDVICLAVTAIMTGIFLGHLEGLGIGTVLAAFTMGKVVGMIGEHLDRHIQFISFLTKDN